MSLQVANHARALPGYPFDVRTLRSNSDNNRFWWMAPMSTARISKPRRPPIRLKLITTIEWEIPVPPAYPLGEPGGTPEAPPGLPIWAPQTTHTLTAAARAVAMRARVAPILRFRAQRCIPDCELSPAVASRPRGLPFPAEASGTQDRVNSSSVFLRVPWQSDGRQNACASPLLDAPPLPQHGPAISEPDHEKTNHYCDHADDTGPVNDPGPFKRCLLPLGVLSVFLAEPFLDVRPSHQAATEAGHLGGPVSPSCNL